MNAVDLPPKVTGPAAWTVADIEAQGDGEGGWRLQLDPEQVAEVEAAARDLIARGVEIAAITREMFPLPKTAPLIQRVVEQCLHGRGFALVSGLDPHRGDIRMAATMYYGIGAHMGSARSQNKKGHILGHVCDLGLSSKDGNVRLYQTTERQSYHTDSCDVVGLMCLNPAKSGGLSGVVSSMSIYNEMFDARPDLLAELVRPLPVDRRGEITADGRSHYNMPVFNYHEGFLSALYTPDYIRTAPRLDDVEPFSRARLAALDMMDALADDPRLRLEFALDAGELLFMHNHTILHNRTEYEEWGEPERRRHILRLWLAVPGARPLPEVYRERYGQLTVGDRGGVIVPGSILNAPLEPV